jgi:hypothetical protein
MAVVAGLAVVVAVAAVTPKLDAPFRRLAKYQGHSGDPLTSVPIDVAAVKRARTIMPPGSRYFVYLPSGPAFAQEQNDLDGVALFYLLPSLRVRHAADAGWVLAYGVGRALPQGVNAARRYPLGGGAFLVRLA